LEEEHGNLYDTMTDWSINVANGGNHFAVDCVSEKLPT